MHRWILALSLALGPEWLPAVEAARLDYLVSEPELDQPYHSRILVTDAFVRLDEGDDDGAYTLYNRVSHRIVNVDPEEETVLVLSPPRRQPQPPGDLALDHSLIPQPDAPEVAGRHPQRLELKASGRLCRVVMVVPGTMEKALQGLRELRLALARLQGAPDPGMDLCEQAELIYAPTRYLDHGLPISDQRAGQTRLLIGFDRALEMDDRFFEVPADYRLVAPPPLQEEVR